MYVCEEVTKNSTDVMNERTLPPFFQKLQSWDFLHASILTEAT